MTDPRHPPPPRGKQPRTRLPKEEAERIIQETIRRLHLSLPGLVAAGIAAATGGGGVLDVLTDDDGNVIVDDDGNIVYAG